MKIFSYIFVIFLIDFINLSDNNLIRFIPTISMGLLFLFNASNTKKNNVARYLKWVYGLIFVLLVGIIRNNNPLVPASVNVYKLVNFLLFCGVLQQTINLNIDRFDFRKILLYMLYIPMLSIIIINLILFIVGLGINSSKETELFGENSLILSILGVSLEPSSFNFILGFVEQRALLGLFLTFFLTGYLIFTKNRKIMIVGIVTTTILLILIDTRAALIYPYIIFFFFFLVMKKSNKPKLLWIIPLITIFGSGLLLYGLSYLSSFSDLSNFSRSSEDFATANSRSLIWLVSSLEFLQFKFIHLVGYGEYGHYESGASEGWAGIFVQWQNPELISPHSTFYIILFDYGYIGLAFMIFLQFKIISKIKKYWNIYREVSLLTLVLLIYWNLIGVTESFFGFYAQNLIYFFIMFCMLIFSLDYLENRKINSLKYEN